MRLTPPVEMTGRWWVPGNREISVVGTLYVDARGRGKLSSEEIAPRTWLPRTEESSSQTVSLPAIHGEVDAGEITLLECTVFDVFLGHGTVDVLCRAVVDGVWLRDADEPAFEQAGITIEHLASWSGRSSLVADFSRPSQQRDTVPVIKSLHIDQLDASFGDLTIRLRWGQTIDTELTNEGARMTVGDVVSFEVAAPQPTSAMAMLQYADILQNLMLFSAGKYAAITSVRLIVHSAWRPEFSEDAPPLVTLHARQRADPDSKRIVPSSDMAFTLQDVDFADMISRWFELSRAFQTVLDTLLGNYTIETQFIENKLTSMVATAEQTYRLVGGKEKFVSDGQLKNIRRAIRELLDAYESAAGNVSEILEKIDNRVTLDTRLRFLVEEVGPAAEVLFGDEAGVDRWLAAAKRSRNDIAHTGITRRYDARALSTIEEATRILVELNILNQLGVGQDVLIKCAQRRSQGRLPLRIRERLPSLSPREDGKS
jgi:hypothetical protein